MVNFKGAWDKTDKIMTYFEVVNAGYPGADDDLVDHIVWSRTLYPFASINAKQLYKASSTLYRAHLKGIVLCNFCDRIAEDKEQMLCKKCLTALNIH